MHFCTDQLNDWRREKQIDQFGIELGATPVSDRSHPGLYTPPSAVTPRVSDRIERVSDGDNSRDERYRFFLEMAWISRPIPSLVVRHHAFWKIRVERGERREHSGTSHRMRPELSALPSIQSSSVVDDIEQGFVKLADVVKQRDALDYVTRMRIRAHGIRQDQGEPGNPPHVRSGNRIVCVDGIE